MEMWRELDKKNLFEGFIEIKKSLVRECIQHIKYSKELENEVWQRLLLDKNFEALEEQIMFSMIEYVRNNRGK